MREVTWTTTSPSATQALAETLGQCLHEGDILLLEGTLGAGKTQFAKGVAVGLAVKDEVTSPTFAMVAEYEGRLPFIHMDLYRLYANPDDTDSGLVANALQQIAFDDYLDTEAVVLVEWPSAVEKLVGCDYLRVKLLAAGDSAMIDDATDVRQIAAYAVGDEATQRLQEWVDRWPS